MNLSAIALDRTLLYAGSVFVQAPAPQQDNATQPNSPALLINTEEVNLDMVFHDKKGKPIHDVRQDEIHVYEDGVEQHLSSFKFVEGSENAPAAAVPET